MNLIKGRAKYTTVIWLEKSYIRNTEATQRSILLNRAKHGCKSLYSHDLSDERTAWRMVGKRNGLTMQTTRKVCGLCSEQAEVLAQIVRAMSTRVDNSEAGAAPAEGDRGSGAHSASQ